MAVGTGQLSGAQQERLAAAEEAVRYLRPYLDRSNVQELAVNDPGRVWLMCNGVWVEVVDPKITFEYLDYLSRNLSEFSKKPFTETKPCIDLEMHTGERFHAKRPPTTPNGHLYINIRKHVTDAYPFEHYAKQGYFETTRHDFAYKITASEREAIRPHLADDEIRLWDYAQAGQWAEFFLLAVSSYQNIVISGATGSGKTTFARSLMELTDPQERYATIADARELSMPNHPNRQDILFVNGEMVEDTADGKKVKRPGMNAKESLESSMRSTPTRVHMSELRSDAAMYYLSGVLSGGHPGGITTTHANNPKAAFNRIALLIKQSQEGQGLDFDTIKVMLYQTINVVAQLKLVPALQRRVMPSIYYDPFHAHALLE